MRLKVVIPAAGKGSRSGLSYPKTLKVFNGVPILIRTLRTVSEIDRRPVVIVSPQGAEKIGEIIENHGYAAELVVQEEPRGMGDAIRCFRRSEFFNRTKEVMVIWGDMLAVRIKILNRTMFLFRHNRSVFAFPSRVSSSCYTHVKRNEKGDVTELLERLEFGDELPTAGESDVGIFMFNKEIVFDILEKYQGSSLIGKTTNEVGFLPVISILHRLGHRVDAFHIADENDSMGFNTAYDIEKAEEALC